MSGDSFLQSRWYGPPGVVSALLTPLSWVFGAVAATRRAAFRIGLLTSHRVSRPVIVVGNLTVGGTGKTPFTLWLAESLRRRGHVPGIVLRGYRGKSATWPRDVTADSNPGEVGDEAVLLAAESGGIVVAGPDRVAAARRAIERGADVIVSDDGLQHYALARDCELVVVDAVRGLGNGKLLPSGPLRESAARVARADAVVLRAPGPAFAAPVASRVIAGVESLASFEVLPTTVVSLQSGEEQPLLAFAGQTVHAVAGIGHPAGFFATLEAAGVNVIPHPLPDHAPITSSTFAFGDDLPVLMTGKDAVKCRGLNNPRLWKVSARAELEQGQAAKVLSLVEQRIAARRAADAVAPRT